MAKKNPRSPERPDAADAAAVPAPTTRRRSSTAPGRAAADAAAPRPDPTHGEIAEAAYQRYLSRGRVHGRDFDDWLEAERELRDRSQGTVTTGGGSSGL
jgi:hypothetical protein